MKQLLLGLSLLLLTIPLSAQRGLKVKKIGIRLGIENDIIKNLDYEYMLSTAKGLELTDFADLEFSPKDYEKGYCENPNVSIDMTLGIPRWSSLDLNITASAVFNRYDGVRYRNNNRVEATRGSEYLRISSYSREAAMELSLIKSYKVFNWWHLNAGAGTNLGYGFGDKVNVNGVTNNDVEKENRSYGDIWTGKDYAEYNYSNLEMRDGFNNRIFAQLGTSFTFFKRIELGIDWRRGIGVKTMFGAGFKQTRLRATYINIRYVLKS